jgi:3',5'-cyclic AMP phosphodiesterase CpdA
MRLAHVSDLHLLSLDGAGLRDFLNKRWTGGMNLLLHRGRHYRAELFDALVEDLNGQGIDHVACTGDVTNLALEAEFRFAREKFDRIAVGAANVTCIPGNHDAYVAEVAGLFDREFAPYCAGDDGWGWPGGERWPVVRVRGDVAIVAVSTGEPTTWFMAHGSVGADQLARLEAALGDPRLEGKLRLVMIHHPPAGARARSVHRGLRDHDALAAVLGRRGADLVLHGHEHLDLRETLPGPAGAAIPVRGIPSATYDGDKAHRTARYRIYDIAAEGGAPRIVGEEVRIWRAAEGRFVAL